MPISEELLNKVANGYTDSIVNGDVVSMAMELQTARSSTKEVKSGSFLDRMKGLQREMIVCVICGNKRCPHAEDEIYACTNSNEPNQISQSDRIRNLLLSSQIDCNEAIAAHHRMVEHDGNNYAYDLVLRGLMQEKKLIEQQLAEINQN